MKVAILSVVTYLFTARWRHRLEHLGATARLCLAFIVLLQDVQITFTRMQTSVFTVCRKIVPDVRSATSNSTPWRLEPIVGSSSIWVGVIVIVHARCRLESVRLQKTSSACRNLFFIIRTIARTSRLSASPQRIVLVYVIGPTCDVIVQKK